MIRWIERNGERILQQAIESGSGLNWVDVPTEKEPPEKMSLAERLHNAKHIACGMSKSDAERNWNQHTSESHVNTWGTVASEAVKAILEEIEEWEKEQTGKGYPYIHCGLKDRIRSMVKE